MPKKNSPVQREDVRLTYKDFDIETFKDEKKLMEDFRKNAHGERMENIWEGIKAEYLPDGSLENMFAKWTLNDDGTASATHLFAVDDDDERIDMKEPLVAIKVHTALSILTQRTPKVRWDSDNDEYESRVEVIDAMRNVDWQDQDSRAQYILMWFNYILYGTTFWRRYFRHEERQVHLPVSVDKTDDSVVYEEQTVIDVDQTQGEALSPFEVLIDPSAQAFKPSTMRKVIYTKIYDFNTFERLFKGVAKKSDMEKVMPTTVEGYEGDRWVKCEYYENKDLDLYYVVANDEEILKDHLPQNHKDLSVMMAAWMPRKDTKNPYGLGPIEMMLPDKKQLDMFKSMTLTQLKFSIYKAIFYTGSLESEGESGDIKIRPDRAYKVTNPKDIQFFDMPGPGQDAYRGMDILRDSVDDSSGINKPLSGEVGSSTAFQTDLAKDAALARLFVPINNIIMLLEQDAALTFELQKQHYTMPDVEPLIDADDIELAFEELEKEKAAGKPTFDIFIDTDEDGGVNVFKAQHRTAQLNVDQAGDGSFLPSRGKNEIVVTAKLFDWKGKIRVVQDALFSMTPTVERTRKMELYNLLIPLFGQPPQLVAKVAQRIVRVYGEDPDDVLPEDWILYLKGIQDGSIPQPQQPGAEVPVEGERPPGRPQEFGPQGREALKFEQQRAGGVTTNIGGQKDLISAQSEAISP